MTTEQMVEMSKKINRAMENFDDWSMKDKFKYLAYMEQLYELVDPIVSKHDPLTPHKFMMKRIDEI